jgi:CheY-like chemotaxis protein
MPEDSILIVEDNEDFRGLVRSALEQEGFTVREASDGQEALARLQESGSSRCLMVMDLMMPGMTGWDLVSAVRSDPLLRGNPIIVSTAVPEESPSGVDAILTKPFGLDSLVAVVERYCSRTVRQAAPDPVPPY